MHSRTFSIDDSEDSKGAWKDTSGKHYPEAGRLSAAGPAAATEWPGSPVREGVLGNHCSGARASRLLQKGKPLDAKRFESLYN